MNERYQVGLKKYYDSLAVAGTAGGKKSKAIIRRYGITEKDRFATLQKYSNDVLTAGKLLQEQIAHGKR